MASVTVLSAGGASNIGVYQFAVSHQPGDWVISFAISDSSGVNSIGLYTRFAYQSIGFLSYYATGYGHYRQFTSTGTSNVGLAAPNSDLGNTVPMSYVFYKLSPGTGRQVVLRASSSLSTSTSSPSIAIPASLTADSIIFGAQCVGDDVFFTDSDTTDGSWSSVSSHTSTVFDRAVASQYKFVTGTSAQTYNGTYSSSENVALMALNFAEGQLGHWGVRA